MTLPFRFCALLGGLLLAGCASVPRQEFSATGAIPQGRTFAVVQPAGDAEPLPAADPLRECLVARGMIAEAGGQVPAESLLQVAYSRRSARGLVLRGAEQPPKSTQRAGRRQDREVLEMTLTDRAGGTVLHQARVTRTVSPRAQPAGPQALAAMLCAGLTPVSAASPR